VRERRALVDGHTRASVDQHGYLHGSVSVSAKATISLLSALTANPGRRAQVQRRRGAISRGDAAPATIELRRTGHRAPEARARL
jgi:transketolase N-terminal domain/subunit